MRKRNFVLAVLLLLAFGGVVGCGSLQTMNTPVDYLYQAQSLYIAQYDDYVYMSERDDLTPEMKDIMRVKLELLKKARVAIDAYAFFVDADAQPTPEAQAELIRIIRQLQFMK